MGDLIDRQSVIDAITDAADKFDWPDDYHHGIKEGIRIGTLICSLMPSKQPEIIYCWECQYWEREKPFATSGRCFIWECTERKGSDYCSEARKVGE